MELSQAIISGAFGIGVAIVTWLLAGLREIGVGKLEARKQKQEKLESLYAKTISQLEMLVRLTEAGDGYDQVKRELSDNNGMLRLLANDAVDSQLQKTSELIYCWSTLYRKGTPKKMGGRIAMITIEDSKYGPQANSLYPEVNKAMIELIDLMKIHIAEFDNA